MNQPISYSKAVLPNSAIAIAEFKTDVAPYS